MKTLCLIFLFVVSISCQDDTLVKGFVYDSKAKPITDVKVIVFSSDIFTETNEEGYFEIDPNGKSDELLFDKQGFELKFVKIENTNEPLKVVLLKKQIE